MIKRCPSLFSSSKPSQRRSQFTRRRLASETLEARVLLASDVVSSWQNPLNRMDVNADQAVSSMDALKIIYDVNQNGSYILVQGGEGEPQSEGLARYFPDVNGDGAVSLLDALSVIRRLNENAEGEGDAVMQFRLEGSQ